MTDFNALLSANTRNDQYVNATKLCKHFGKRLQHWKDNQDTENFLVSLENKLAVKRVNLLRSRGRAGTWAHPLVAIKLAEWLDSDFEIFVKETFKAFLDADISLAESIVDRTDDIEGVKQLKQRAKAKIARNVLTSTIDDHVDYRKDLGKIIGSTTNATYRGMYGVKNADELRQQKGLAKKVNIRDNMSERELARLENMEDFLASKIEDKNIRNWDIPTQTEDMAKKLTDFMKSL